MRTPVVPPKPSKTPSGGQPHQAEVMQPAIRLICATVFTLLMYKGFTKGAGSCADLSPGVASSPLPLPAAPAVAEPSQPWDAVCRSA